MASSDATVIRTCGFRTLHIASCILPLGVLRLAAAAFRLTPCSFQPCVVASHALCLPLSALLLVFHVFAFRLASCAFTSAPERFAPCGLRRLVAYAFCLAPFTFVLVPFVLRLMFLRLCAFASCGLCFTPCVSRLPLAPCVLSFTGCRLARTLRLAPFRFRLAPWTCALRFWLAPCGLRLEPCPLRLAPLRLAPFRFVSCALRLAPYALHLADVIAAP